MQNDEKLVHFQLFLEQNSRPLGYVDLKGSIFYMYCISPFNISKYKFIVYKRSYTIRVYMACCKLIVHKSY